MWKDVLKDTYSECEQFFLWQVTSKLGLHKDVSLFFIFALFYFDRLDKLQYVTELYIHTKFPLIANRCENFHLSLIQTAPAGHIQTPLAPLPPGWKTEGLWWGTCQHTFCKTTWRVLTQKGLKYVAMEVQRRKYPWKLRNLRISTPVVGVT